MKIFLRGDIMGKKDLWSKNWQLIEQAPLKPIVSLGKGIEAAIYISREMIRERELVVDRDFSSYGTTFKEIIGKYKFREITQGGLKVDPPIPSPQGCAHEYFAFYRPSEIRQRFSGFKENINVVHKNKEGFAIFYYGAQKLG